jgi:hypothetical protein
MSKPLAEAPAAVDHSPDDVRWYGEARGDRAGSTGSLFVGFMPRTALSSQAQCRTREGAA